MKPKLSVEQQIQHMKLNGIGFNIIPETEARDYLKNNTYYFKLKAYAKNYAKYQIGEKKGQYVNLEFAYLKDMSIIDMRLRHFILQASTDLEHAVKVRFLNDFNNSQDDGYELVKKYLAENPDVEDIIKSKKENSYTKDLAEKLCDEGFAIWNIIELLSLKDFLVLYRRFYEEYPDALQGINLYYPMQGVRKIRNAAAHNNCIINSLRKPYTGKISYNSKVDRFVNMVPNIGKTAKSNNKRNQVIYDFVTLLYLVDEVIESVGVKTRILSDAKDLFSTRMIEHAEYYSKESSITSAYEYVNKIVDFLYEKAYNNGVI